MAEFLLYLVIPEPDRRVIARELEETHSERAASSGRRAATFRYWVAALKNIAWYGKERILTILQREPQRLTYARAKFYVSQLQFMPLFPCDHSWIPVLAEASTLTAQTARTTIAPQDKPHYACKACVFDRKLTGKRFRPAHRWYDSEDEFLHHVNSLHLNRRFSAKTTLPYWRGALADAQSVADGYLVYRVDESDTSSHLEMVCFRCSVRIREEAAIEARYCSNCNSEYFDYASDQG